MRQGQSQIGVEIALVKFIKNHQPDAGQFRVRLQHAGEDALGHHFDAGGRANTGFQADAVTHGLPHGFTQLPGHKAGGIAGG